MKRPLSLAQLNAGFGWTERDASYTFVHARHQTSSPAGPEVTPGDVYQVHYDKPFAWSRHTRTNYMYGPDGSSSACTAATQLKYSWKSVKSLETQLHTSPNYMFVLGTVNHTQSRQLLVLFYKPCSNVDITCTVASNAVPQGTWLPAIYSPDTGVLFSEVGEAHVHGRSDTLGWTSRSRVHTILNTAYDCGVDLEMSCAEVTAKRITNTTLLNTVRLSILQPMFAYLLQSSGAAIAEFANLNPTLESLAPYTSPYQAIIYANRTPNFAPGAKPSTHRFLPSDGYNAEHNRQPDLTCPGGPCPTTSVSCSCD